jgi:uncharacterized protein YlxW (UPF0749 family)
MPELGVFTMVVMIVLIVTIGRVLRAKYGDPTLSRRGRRYAALVQQNDGTNEEAARLRNEVTRLNDRIQVLERLATDPAKRLSDEIEQLKSK